MLNRVDLKKSIQKVYKYDLLVRRATHIELLFKPDVCNSSAGGRFKERSIHHSKIKKVTLAVLKRGSSCCAVNHFKHGSLNLAFTHVKLYNIFIFGMAYTA